tara:strand:+ start:234 stop:482 length:249 start_codon:yes stop_codon:yes gene_type:complete
MTTGQTWVFNKRKNMKNILIILAISLFSSSAFAGSCPMLAKKVETKIETAKKLHDQGVAAHSSGDHAKSEELLKKALELFKG